MVSLKDLINSHNKRGTTVEDIIKRNGYEQILENVVIAPCWKSSIFKDYSQKIEQFGEKVFNVYGKDFEFSFLEINNMGASSILECVLPLGLTKCKRIIFIGSVGSLDENINIGDLVVPTCSYNGVGACRFLNKNLEDDFETKTYPNKELTNQIISVLSKDFKQHKIHQTVNYSVDTMFAQFLHIQHFIDLGCQTIEMETSSLFKCGELANIQTSALLCVSDNTLRNKSLYSGRNEEERKLRREVRNKIIPQIIINVFKS